MKQKKELILSMLQEQLKTKWFIFSVVVEAWRTKTSFLQLHLHTFLSEDPAPSFSLPALCLSVLPSLCIFDSISIADFLLDLATFLLVPVEINYKRKNRKSVVLIYMKEQPKHQAPLSSPGVGKEMEICNHNAAENWATTLKLWIYWAPRWAVKLLGQTLKYV